MADQRLNHDKEVAIGVPVPDPAAPRQPVSSSLGEAERTTNRATLSSSEKEINKKELEQARPCLVLTMLIVLFCFPFWYVASRDRAPKIKVERMDFTVLNISESRITAKWDVFLATNGATDLFRGDLQVSVLYKNGKVASSLSQRYEVENQLTYVSVVADEKNIENETGKGIMEDIEKSGEVSFGTELLLMNHRQTTTWAMRYTCGDVKLGFLHSSRMLETKLGEGSTCNMTKFDDPL